MYLSLLDLDAATQEMVRDGRLPVAEAVKAIRRERARERQRTGGKPHGVKLTWEPDHFTGSHPLARSARAACEARGHNNRRRLGKSGACGQCWETVIRADERQVADALSRAPAEPVAV